ncbi:MAG: hypothetical protein M1368_11220, partial [Thaumarchaeota archaeon]|nr:hypothetical protein [Nitrososphaerota archaeon]
ITLNENRLDRFWLSSKSLDSVSGENKSSGFGLRYFDYFSADKKGRPKLSVRLWSGNIEAILTGLRDIPEIRKRIALYRIGLQLGDENEDISSNGRISLRSGKSVHSHLSFAEETVKYYSSIIDTIETQYVLRYNAGHDQTSATVDGSYCFIELSKDKDGNTINPIPNLRAFAQLLTSGNDPFRIFGASRQVTENLVKVKGIDQHTQSPIELEILPDKIRIILGEDVCGNIVTRLFTNFQNYFDSGCKLKGLDNSELI